MFDVGHTQLLKIIIFTTSSKIPALIGYKRH